MPRDSLAYRKPQQEAHTAESATEGNDVAVNKKSQRATRSSHGIVKLKRYHDVIDWSQRRSAAKGDKRLRCGEESIDQDVRKEHSPEAVAVEAFSEAESGVLGKLAAKALARTSRRVKAKASPTPVAPSPCAIACDEGDKSDSNRSENERKGDVVGIEETESKQPISLALLLEEHKRVEAALESFGKMLKEYQGAICGEKSQAGYLISSSRLTSVNQRREASIVEQQATQQSNRKRIRDEGHAMQRQQDGMDGSPTPPRAETLLLRASRGSTAK